MPQALQLFRMLVASPADCGDERTVIQRVVAEWNAIHSLQSAVAVECVLWELHARAELGDRPQAIINSQLVNSCDFVVGVFWTRLGTPTGVAVSGTAEEIEQFRSAGKQILLYFSTTPIAPDLIDPKQYQALRDYQKSVQATGLTFGYSGVYEFERLFSRQLAHLMASLTAQSAVVAETLARGLAGAASEAEREHDLIDILRSLRHDTKFFWSELVELSPYRDNFTAEMQARTYDKVKTSLDYLACRGHLSYRVEHAYDKLTDKSPVVNVIVENVTTQLKNVAKYVGTGTSKQ
jgi:hypothetical protein